MIPKEQGDQTGPNYTRYYIGRIETYIDKAGVIKKAVAYGKDAGTMKIWFHYDEILQALGTWVIPEVPYWYNNKKWNSKLRKEHEKINNSGKSDKEQNKNNEQYKKREDPRKGQKQQHKGYDPRRPESANDYYPEEYHHRERHPYSQNPRHYSDWEEDYNEIPYSGVGRTAGPSYPTRREREPKPGYYRGRSKSRGDYETRHREGRYEDRSQSRERRRGDGADRAKKLYYGNSGRS